MITSSDSFTTYDLGKYYVILPVDGPATKHYALSNSAQRVEPGFVYNSGTNSSFLTVEQMRSLIREHVDTNFSPV